MPDTKTILELIDNAMHGLSFEDAKEFLEELIAELEGRINALEDENEVGPDEEIKD